jgi:nucleoside-diphosphate-sugar epimerase
LKVLITGAGGFIGRALTTDLLQAGELQRDEVKSPITEMLLVDQPGTSLDTDPSRNDINIKVRLGDLTQTTFVEDVMSFEPDAIFHLAATLTLAAEVNNDLSYRLNIACLHQIIQRTSPKCRFVYTSSIAVFGDELPDCVDDAVNPKPKTTYGTHKAMAELMLADASRKGLMDARSLRLPIVLVRDASHIPTVSELIASIVREPLNGNNVECGIGPNTRMPVASVGAVAKALIKLHNLANSQIPTSRTINLPSLTVTPALMVDALTRTDSISTIGKVFFKTDPVLQTIVEGWPRELTSNIALSLGIKADDNIDQIIEDYLRRNLKT